MATKTVHKELAAVLIHPENSEYLEYRLGIRGSSANFALADDQPQTALQDTDFPEGGNELVWRLQTAIEGDSVRVTSKDTNGQPKGDYTRLVSLRFLATYAMAMAFVTAVGYRLQIRRFSNDNRELELVFDVEYKMETQGESVRQDIGVQLGGGQ
ncbi:MAG TPA: hypothetical protein VG759_26885 [Candidatus Angelobacter sp.]|jgi:hypothetical protein|nr:hypothetical protein [Candidatus Angelobacter sp.]